MNRTIRTSAALLTMAALALATSPAYAGKSGPDAPIILRLGTIDPEDRPDAPIVRRFAQRVEQLTDGAVTLDVRWGAAGGVTDAEPTLIGMVQGGDLELGWAGSRAFDVMGVPTLQAIQAPFLITDYALLRGVLTSDLSAAMIAGLETAGLVGLGLFPDGLRYPVGFSGPFLTLADFQGARIRVPTSDAGDALMRALGAEPRHLNGSAFGEARDGGELEGVEISMAIAPDFGATDLTGNLAFYPRVNTLFASARAMAALTDEQRLALREAAADALDLALEELPEQDESDGFCALGGRVVMAEQADLDAIVGAARPVYAALETDPVTRDTIAAIQALKASIPPGPALRTCEGGPDPTPLPSGDLGVVFPFVGRWETPQLTPEQIAGRLEEAGYAPEEYAMIVENEGFGKVGIAYAIVISEDGRWSEQDSADGRPFEPGWEGTWEATGDDLITATERGVTIGITYRWEVDGDQLRFEIVDHPFDRFDEMMQTHIFTTAPFTRVD